MFKHVLGSNFDYAEKRNNFLWVPAVSERRFLIVSSESSLILESQAKRESREGVLSEQIPMVDLLSEGSLFDQRSVKILCSFESRVPLRKGSSSKEL